MISRGINAPTVIEVAQTFRIPPQAVHEIVRLGVESGEITQLSDTLFFVTDQLFLYQDMVVELANQGPFSTHDFREKTGAPRKVAVGILDYFDSIGITEREDDLRTLSSAQVVDVSDIDDLDD